MIDHSLNEYYAACRLDSDSDGSSTTSPKEAGISSWSAESVVSPLRGRARMLGGQHRMSCSNSHHRQLRLHIKETELESCGASESQDNFHRIQGQTAKQVIRALNQPLSAHLSCATTGEEDDFAQRDFSARPSQGYSFDTRNGPPKTFDEARFHVLLLFDVMCALRLSACKFCVQETGPGICDSSQSRARFPASWRLKPEVRDQLLSGKDRTIYVSALQKLLNIADDIHALQARLDAFYEQYHRVKAQADSTYTVEADFFFGKASIGDRTVHADRAIGLTSLGTLLRFAELVSAWIQEFKVWVFQVQENLMVNSRSGESSDPLMNGPGMGLRTSSLNITGNVPRASPPLVKDFAPRGVGKGGDHVSLQSSQPYSIEGVRKMYKTEGTSADPTLKVHSTSGGPVFLTNSYLPQIISAVERNAILLQQCLVIIDGSSCFNTFHTKLADSGGVAAPGGRSEEDHRETTAGQPPPLSTSAMAEFAFLNQCTELGAALLDYLIIQLSALQHPGAMDLYRLYMSLLIHCAWPYVILSTSTMFGFVHDIDSQKWRHQLPRLFRSSFSHIRVGGAHRRYPTDVLSLVLSCVDYQKSAVSLEPFKTLSMLLSARRSILYSLLNFARQKHKSLIVKDRGEKQDACIAPNTTTTTTSSPIQPTGSSLNLPTEIPAWMNPASIGGRGGVNLPWGSGTILSVAHLDYPLRTTIKLRERGKIRYSRGACLGNESTLPGTYLPTKVMAPVAWVSIQNLSWNFQERCHCVLPPWRMMHGS
ncbi:unnamed protein product [Phytomonas sp. EM1]|nr:unnamed protein product [Phytomonas sp. EM1]|eukprot:CCW61794.1 unnamed protein product [Phytomonas sp. isolate EM1]